MDSKEARRQENGEHSSFCIIEHVHIHRKGEEAEMVIIGGVCNTHQMEKLLQETIIPMLATRCGLTKERLTIKDAEANPN